MQCNSTLNNLGGSFHISLSHSRLQSVEPFLENAIALSIVHRVCICALLVASPFYISSEWGDQPIVTGVGRIA